MIAETVKLETITDAVRKRSEGRKFPYTVKFSFPDIGCLCIDGSQGAVSVTNNDDAAQVTLKMTIENFWKMFCKEISAQRAAMTGKIKFAGNVGIAMQLGKILD
jgi:putative sterol carrier protein